MASLVLAEALVLGLVGGAIGTVVAWLVASLVDRLATKVLPEFPFKPDTYFSLPGWLLIGGVGLGVIAALGGAWLPARRAAAIDPRGCWRARGRSFGMEVGHVPGRPRFPRSQPRGWHGEGTATTDEGAAERENVYRRLFEDSRDALVVLIPPSSRFSDANAAALRVFGAADKAAFLALGPAGVSPERQPDGRPSTEKVLEMTALTLREGAYLEQRNVALGEVAAPDIDAEDLL